jgi:pimeloyl-ACP methyl ester carboxylesterase
LRLTPVRAVAVLLVVLLVVGVAGLGIGLVLQDDDAEGTKDGTGGDATPALVPTPTPQPGSQDAPEPGLAEFYSQALDWEICPSGDDECATLTVPLDYQQPDGETIDLAVLKVPAEDQDARLGSMVVDPGGPGAPATTYASDGGWGDALTEHYDIVGMDPRGVGESDPVDCLPDQELDAYLATDPDPDSPDEVATFQAENEKFAAGCEANSGARAAHVSTIEAARDMDVLRAALGDATLTYFGASYGTKLGATYAEFFPDRVGRLVLDGAVDPTLTLMQATTTQAKGFETALRAYVQNCLDEEDCFLGDSLEAGLDRISTFLDDVDQTPLTTQFGDRELTEGLAYYGIVAALYSRDSWVYLDQGLQLALEGDGSILALLADSYASRDQDGTYLNNILEAFPTISCLDDPTSVPFDEVPDLIPELEQASPTFGRTFAWGLTVCAGFTARSTEQPRPLRAAGAPPIVVIGTTRDPATPFEEAVALAYQLESGVLVSRDGDGHTGYNSGNDCVDGAVEDYLVEGTVPEDGLEC